MNFNEDELIHEEDKAPVTSGLFLQMLPMPLHSGSDGASEFSDPIQQEIKATRRRLAEIENVVAEREREIEHIHTERTETLSRLEKDIKYLSIKVKMKQKYGIDIDMNNPKRLDFKVRRSQKVPFKHKKSLHDKLPSLARQYSEMHNDRNETFAEFALRMKRENRELISFDMDTFSLMMLHPVNSHEWLLGVFVIAFVWMFMILIIYDAQSQADESGTPLGIPYSVPIEVTVAQIFSVLVCVSAQTDILSSLRLWLGLRYNEESEWNTIVNLEGDENRTFKKWMIRIFTPIIAKMITGLIILTVNFVTIVQANDIVELMIDVGALLLLQRMPEYLFLLVQYGYLGQKFEDSSKDLLEHSFPDPLPFSCVKSFFNLRVVLFLTLILGLGGACGFMLQNQLSGEYFRRQYPYCDITKDQLSLFGNGVCEGSPSILNTIDCDFDGGDCVSYNLQYPNCDAVRPYEVGDGICQEIYNKKECNFDGADCCPISDENPRFGDKTCDGGMYATQNCKYDKGDCDSFRVAFFECKIDEISREFIDDITNAPRLGDGICESAVYNTEECGFENGDCVECNSRVSDYTLTGDGVCHGGHHNTEICNMDARDCDDFNRKYPRCYIHTKPADDVKLPVVPIIGDGICNSALYNNAECGFEDGDCVLCNLLVEDRTKLGNGMCDGGNYMSEACGYDGGDCIGCDAPRFEVGNSWCTPQYNTTECGYDGGDCIVKSSVASPACVVEFPSLIGNGYCNGGAYNTEACGWDGGDCEQTAAYPDCISNELSLLGDGICHGFLNTEECGFDGGDCDEFNLSYPNCTVDFPSMIGNDFCDFSYNTPECGFDGGDCIIVDE